jgi:membrane protease subunit (stomatin/prohibitin family)
MMMYGRRRVGRPLLRGALIGGAGYMAGKRMAAGTQRENEQDAAIADLQTRQSQTSQTQPAQPAQPAQPQAEQNIADRLAQLAQMQQQGLLTPEEFTAAKARLLQG